MNKKYPALFKLLTPVGIVFVCERHAKQIIALYEIFGFKAYTVPLSEAHECRNCINECEGGDNETLRKEG